MVFILDQLPFLGAFPDSDVLGHILVCFASVHHIEITGVFGAVTFFVE
jgi:hypothetical protein